jgi:hypothetical protein
MVTESIMIWVFWYLSYIISSYKHWNVECVWDNHPFIGCILHISVLVNIGCFDIGCILHIGVLVNKGIMEWVLLH